MAAANGALRPEPCSFSYPPPAIADGDDWKGRHHALILDRNREASRPSPYPSRLTHSRQAMRPSAHWRYAQPDHTELLLTIYPAGSPA